MAQIAHAKFHFNIGDIVRIVVDQDGISNTVGHTGIVTQRNNAESVKVRSPRGKYNYYESSLILETDEARLTEATKIDVSADIRF